MNQTYEMPTNFPFQNQGPLLKKLTHGLVKNSLKQSKWLINMIKLGIWSWIITRLWESGILQSQGSVFENTWFPVGKSK